MADRTFLPVTANSQFSLANVPFGIISTAGNPDRRAATAIGEYVIDLSVLAAANAFQDLESVEASIFCQPNLNALAAKPLEIRRSIRSRIQKLLLAGSSFAENAELRGKAVFELNQVQLHLPVAVGDYTDFCASEYHTKNLGRLIDLGGPPMPPSWIHIPIGYHGRASSIVVSGTAVHRPKGAVPTANGPVFAACKALDFELEIAAVVGGLGNVMGQRFKTSDVEENVFGLVLMNDLSARDVQGFEMAPLGPFNGKNFGTTISPWIVTLDALQPFATALPQRPVEAEGTEVLQYLREENEGDTSSVKSSFDIELEVVITPTASGISTTIAKSNLRYLSYSFGQMLAHQTVGGCPVRAGDLLGSGTISGPTPEQLGSFIELSQKGANPYLLKDKSTRRFLEDGDTIELRGVAGSDEYSRVGFGSATTLILSALD